MLKRLIILAGCLAWAPVLAQTLPAPAPTMPLDRAQALFQELQLQRNQALDQLVDARATIAQQGKEIGKLQGQVDELTKKAEPAPPATAGTKP